MAEEDFVNETAGSGQTSDRQLASVLYKQKRQARDEKKSDPQPSNKARAVKSAGTAAQASGKAIQAGGAATQYGGKAVKYGGKGIQAAGKGVRSGGQALTKAGAGLTDTGVGAIVGVPLAILGAGLTGVGAGAQAVGKGVEAGGQATEKSGQLARQSGRNLSGFGTSLKREANNLGGLRSAKKDKSRDRGKSLASVTNDAMGGSQTVSNMVHLMATPIRIGTDWALRASWEYLIPSWGLTLIWINIHVFFRFVLGTNFFCKLGHEWVSSPMKGGGGMTATKTTTVSASGKMMSEFGNVVGKVEGAGGVVEALILAGTDLLVLLAILIIVAIITAIVGAVVYPIEFFGQVLF